MKEGIEWMAEKRAKQIDKGFTIDHDIQHEPGDNLLKAAIATIEGDASKFPDHWTNDERKRVLDHWVLDRVAIAGAFLAAYIDKDQKERQDYYKSLRDDPYH